MSQPGTNEAGQAGQAAWPPPEQRPGYQPPEQETTPIGDAAERASVLPASGAEQQAAGQPGPAQPPEPDPVNPPEELPEGAPVVGATSNESPRLPGNLTSSAARAHAALAAGTEATSSGELSESERLSLLRRFVDFALNELDRFVPDHVREPAANEVSRDLQ